MDKTGKEHETDSKRHPVQAHFRIGIYCRAPYGARGLKHKVHPVVAVYVSSRPVRGAWIETMALSPRTPINPSRAPYGARGLKRRDSLSLLLRFCRAPYGARGLKPHCESEWLCSPGSRPVRGAWIETSECLPFGLPLFGRAPYGARGLKHHKQTPIVAGLGRAPYGARGLKRDGVVLCRRAHESRPVRGAWIETLMNRGIR